MESLKKDLTEWREESCEYPETSPAHLHPQEEEEGRDSKRKCLDMGKCSAHSRHNKKATGVGTQ